MVLFVVAAVKDVALGAHVILDNINPVIYGL